MQKLEDEEDLRDIRAARIEMKRKGTIPWEKVKAKVVDEKKHPTGLLRPVGWPGEKIPLAERRKQFLRKGAALRRELQKKGITEQQIDRDIEALFKRRR